MFIPVHVTDGDCRSAVLLALCFGVMLAPCRHVTVSVLWWIIGFASFIALYLLPTWQAFAGKLSPVVLHQNLVRCQN